MARKKNDLNFTQFRQTLRVSNNPAVTQQNLTERMYIRIFTELASNRFKWEGLPPEIDVRFLELNLFAKALVVFFKDTGYQNSTEKFMAMRASSTGMWNFNDNPTKFTVIGNNWGSRELAAFKVGDNPAQCVPIWGNYLRTPDWDIVALYSAKLAQIDRSIEIAALNMRHTTVMAVDENERLSYVNAFKQFAEGQPVIFGSRQFDLSKIQAFNIAPHHDTIDRLQIAKTRMWNEAMTYLGINNANQDKKERLVADEVAANDEQVSATKNIALNARKEACEAINRLYGLNVSVKFNVQDPPPVPGNDETGTPELKAA
jgi:hypothetical protein